MNHPVPCTEPEKPKTRWVRDLQSASAAYWDASNAREQQAAYHEILLFGGKDGYPSHGRSRAWIIRVLRLIAYEIERE